ncbi:MAG: CheY-like chemotaxis protein, partial [Lentisphaeria bacterium]
MKKPELGKFLFVSQINYQGISVLIADDFSSFRNTVNGMLLNLGVSDIDSASNGEEVIDRCDRKSFDVILCDYDLGPGRSGQHVLEELRFRKSITRRNIFIMVSAEASRNIVMSAYDCEPDDYLMKPITGLMLQQRMARLLVQREVLKASYNALDAGDVGKAMDLLIDLSIAENRYSTTAQKILGELFIKQNELQKAEKLYTRALEVRPLDWAR